MFIFGKIKFFIFSKKPLIKYIKIVRITLFSNFFINNLNIYFIIIFKKSFFRNKYTKKIF